MKKGLRKMLQTAGEGRPEEDHLRDMQSVLDAVCPGRRVLMELDLSLRTIKLSRQVIQTGFEIFAVNDHIGQSQPAFDSPGIPRHP